MALTFNGLEPVNFGGKDCAPKVDAELNLRLTRIKTYDKDADELLASAFPGNEEYVTVFLTDKMTTFDKEILHAYLIGGEKMVETVLKRAEGAFGE